MRSETIKTKISEFAKIPLSKIEDNKEITELVADSFMLVEMMLNLQEEFEIELEQEDLVDVKTVLDMVSMVQDKMHLATA